MYRPPVGIPRRERGRWQGWLASLLAHLLLLVLILVPVTDSGPDLGHRSGAGGAGQAGGGGGGLGDDAPRLQFVSIAPAAATPSAARVTPTSVPVAPEPKRDPVQRAVAPTVAAPATPKQVPVPAAQSASGTASAGGLGLGRTGGAGPGPGSGGGVGSGEGTGHGSAVGPGTGGGTAKTFPPTPIQFFLPPLPAPKSLHGFRLTAWYDVDSTGKSSLIRFTPSPDGGYNRRLRETLLAVRFRPAVRPDGTPVRDTVDIRFDF